MSRCHRSDLAHQTDDLVPRSRPGVSLLIPSWHSGSMVTVLRGTRQACGPLRAINCLRARSPLSPAPTFATAAAPRAGSDRRPEPFGPYGCDALIHRVSPQDLSTQTASRPRQRARHPHSHHHRTRGSPSPPLHASPVDKVAVDRPRPSCIRKVRTVALAVVRACSWSRGRCEGGGRTSGGSCS